MAADPRACWRQVLPTERLNAESLALLLLIQHRREINPQ
jgi:hypothetical protein